MRRPAPVIIRRTEARDRGLKPRRMLKHFSPLMLQFAIGEGIPYLNGRGEVEHIVDVPVGLANRCKMMADASSNAAMAAGASNVPVKSRDKREPPQPADDEPLSLLNRKDQDVSALAFGHFDHRVLEVCESLRRPSDRLYAHRYHGDVRSTLPVNDRGVLYAPKRRCHSVYINQKNIPCGEAFRR